MDPLEVGVDGCELNGGGDAEAGNLNVGHGSMAMEIRMQAYV